MTTQMLTPTPQPDPGGPPSGGATPGGGGMMLPPIDQLKGRPLGRVLTKMGRVTREQVDEALAVQAEHRKPRGRHPIGQILVDLGLITRQGPQRRPGRAAGTKSTRLDGRESVEGSAARRSRRRSRPPTSWCPSNAIAKSQEAEVVIASPDNFRAVDDLRQHPGLQRRSRPSATRTQIDKLLAKHYGGKQESLGDLMTEISSDDTLKDLEGRGESIDLETLKDAADSNPVRKLINLVLLQAIKDKASDIHFEPFEDEFKMRYRIDGVLYEMMPPPAHIAPAISSRIKVMANLDIAERRMPQDGRIELNVNNQPIDLRVSVLPTMFGESVVMRVLDRSNVSLDLDKIGMREDDLRVVPPADPQAQRHRARHRPDRLR